MTLADLKGKPVVSMADGAKIGEVDDLIFDTGRWAIVELYVVGKPGRGLVPLGLIKGIGPDAVTIERADVVAYNTVSSGLCFDALRHLHVVDGTGTTRGNVADVQFGSDGLVESFEVRQGGVFGIGAHHLTVTPGEIRGVGDKIVTVEVPTTGD